MTSQTSTPRSWAVKATWISLGLAVGCWLMFLLGQVLNQIFPFSQSPQGLLTGYVPRIGLLLLWAGEALAAIVGLTGLFLIRKADIDSQAVNGIVMRSMFSIAVGSIGVIFFWLFVGHVVIGF